MTMTMTMTMTKTGVVFPYMGNTPTHGRDFCDNQNEGRCHCHIMITSGGIKVYERMMKKTIDLNTNAATQQ